MIRSKLHTSLFIFIGMVLLVITFTGCETGRAGCEGKIVVENQIPDTTLYLGGEPFRRDVFANPPVFVHTANQHMSLLIGTKTGTVTNVTIEVNEETGKASIIQVEPRTTGEDEVIVTAMDACPDYEVKTSFNVTVKDTTN